MKLFLVVWGLTGLFAWGKVVGHLDWSWWLVFVAPLSVLFAVLALFAVMLVIELVENRK